MALPRLAGAQTAARRLAGVFPIGFTPVNAQNQVDYDGLAAQVQFCRRGGVHGLVRPVEVAEAEVHDAGGRGTQEQVPAV